MYYAMYAVGFALMMVLNCFRHRDYRVGRRRAVVYTLITYVYGVLSAMAMGRIYSAICAAKGISDNSSVAIFGAVIFTPLLLIVSVCVEKAILSKSAPKALVNKRGNIVTKKRDAACVRNTLDLLAPGIFIILTCAKLGCAFEGCCYGELCDWGAYSARAEATVFPVQLFEVGTMCVVLLVCFFLKRTRFYRRGMAYPLTAAVYSVARFGWEYKRFYAEALRHIVFGLTFWQFCCVVVFVASVISLIALYRTRPGEPLPKWKNNKNRA